jgi:SAM-dependent methyltransferase
MKATFRTFWDDSPLGAVQREQGFFLKDYEKHLFERVRDMQTGTGNLLVVGVGAGREIPGIAGILKPRKITALDLSPAMIDSCRSNLAKADLGSTEIDVICGNFLDEDFPEPFDLVYFSNCTIAYIDTSKGNHEALKRKTMQITVPGSVIVMELPKSGRWGWKNPILFSMMMPLGLRFGQWGLVHIRSGSHFAVYKNYTHEQASRLFDGMAFRELFLSSKSEFRRSKARSVSDDTLFGIYRRD